MASNSGFTDQLPSDTSAASLGDDDLRSIKSFMFNWWEDEHYALDGSATSAGVHKAGSARAFSQSAAPTAVAPIGQIWHDTDTNELSISTGAGTSNWTIASVAPASAVPWTSAHTFSGGVAFSGGVDFTSAVTLTSTLSTDALAYGGVFTQLLSGSSTTNLASIGAGNQTVFTITVTNATAGSPVIVGTNVGVGTDLVVTAECGSANLATVRVSNISTAAVNPGNATYNVIVFDA